MPAFPVVKAFNVPENIMPGFLTGLVKLVIQPFRLDGAEEGLRASIVPTVSLPAHAADHLKLLQSLLIIVTAILDALIGVMN